MGVWTWPETFELDPRNGRWSRENDDALDFGPSFWGSPQPSQKNHPPSENQHVVFVSLEPLPRRCPDAGIMANRQETMVLQATGFDGNQHETVDKLQSSFTQYIPSYCDMKVPLFLRDNE